MNLWLRDILLEGNCLGFNSARWMTCGSLSVLQLFRVASHWKHFRRCLNFESSGGCIFAGLESLPTELQRNFNLMRDLDTRSHGQSATNKCAFYAEATCHAPLASLRRRCLKVCCVLNRFTSTNRHKSRRIRTRGQRDGPREKEREAEIHPETLQQKQRVWRRQSSAGHADVRNGECEQQFTFQLRLTSDVEAAGLQVSCFQTAFILCFRWTNTYESWTQTWPGLRLN